MVRNALCVYKNRIQVIPLELRVMFFTVLTEDDIGKNSKSNEATKHFHCWSIFMFQSRKSVDDGIVRSYSHNYLLGTVADFFLSQSFTYILPLLNPTKISGGGGGEGESNMKGVTSFLSKLLYWIELLHDSAKSP